MSKIIDLRPTRPDDALRRLLSKATASNTRAHGVKVAQPGDYTAYPAADGSLRRLDADYVDRVQGQIDGAAGEVAAAAERLAAAEAELEAAQGRIDETTALLGQLDEQAAASAEQVAGVVKDMEADRARLTAAQADLDALKPRLGDVEGAVSASDARMTKLSAEAAGASSSAQDAMLAAQTAEARVQALANAQGSLILNGGFEQPVDETAEWRYATSAAHGGSYVGRFLLSNGARDITWPKMRAARGQSLELRYWARGLGNHSNTSMQAYIVVERNDGTVQSTYATSDSIIPTLSRNWQEFVVRFAPLPEGTRSVTPRTGVRPSGGDDGYVFMDDVTLHDVASYQEALDSALAARAEAERASQEALDAMERANAAYDSASGKNAIRNATTTPQGVGTVTGDVWRQWSAYPGGNVTAEWAWDGTAWRAQQLSHQMLSSLDLGKATVGQLHGSYITAGSIGADRMTIGVGVNALADPYFTDVALRDTRSAASTGAWTYSVSGGRPCMELTTPITGVQTFRYARLGIGSLIPTVAGRKWRIEVPMYLSGGRARVNVRWYDALGSAFSYVAAGDLISGPGDITVVGEVTSPSQAVGFLVDVYIPGTSEARTAKVYGGASVVAKTGTVHIEDGAVKAQQVDAESVAGAVGQFVKVRAENVDVTDTLAARVLSAATSQVGTSFVTDRLVVGTGDNRTVLEVLGTAVVNDLNLRGTLRGRDAILDGTLDVDQLNVTGDMAAEIGRYMRLETKKLIVTESAVMQHITAVEGVITPQIDAVEARLGDLVASKASIADIEGGNLTLTGNFRSGAEGKPGVIIPQNYVTEAGMEQLGVWLSPTGLAPSLGSEMGTIAGMWLDNASNTSGSTNKSQLHIRGQGGRGIRVWGDLQVVPASNSRANIHSDTDLGIVSAKGDVWGQGNSLNYVARDGDLVMDSYGAGSTKVNAWGAGHLVLGANNNVNVNARVDANVRGFRDVVLKSGDSIKLFRPDNSPYANSWTAGGLKTVYMGGSSGTVYTDTSSRRFKVDIETAKPDHEWLDMRTVTYRDRIAVELKAEIEARRAAGDCTPLTAGEHERLAIADQVIPGRIAEEGVGVADAQVVLDGSGQVESWDYSRDAVMLTPHVREHRDKIVALEARLNALEGAT